MKKIILLLLLIELTWAENKLVSDWSLYIQNPSDKNAEKVNNVNNGNTDKGLQVLKKKIEEGSNASLKLAIRLDISTLSGLDGEAAETIPELISYGAGVNPQGYVHILEKLNIKECLHIEPMGLEYVDGKNIQKKLNEYNDKYNKFKNLEKSILQQKCMNELKVSILILKTEFNSLRIAVLHEYQCIETKELLTQVLFRKEGKEFIREDGMSEPLQWHIAFDGRYLGVLKENQIKIKNRTNSFSGWCHTPTYRPLVLVTKKYFKDPAQWKPFTPKRNMIIKLFPHLKKRIGKLASIDFSYTVKDLILLKSYKNIKKEKLIQISFNLKNSSCEGKSDAWCKRYWFYISEEKVKFIGENLEPVDAGDYDNNGQSEVLFWKSGYNKDGYQLFYNQFEKSIEKSWSYH